MQLLCVCKTWNNAQYKIQDSREQMNRWACNCHHIAVLLLLLLLFLHRIAWRRIEKAANAIEKRKVCSIRLECWFELKIEWRWLQLRFKKHFSTLFVCRVSVYGQLLYKCVHKNWVLNSNKQWLNILSTFTVVYGISYGELLS